MSEYTATIRWMNKDDNAFTKNTYSREHVWEFDGGVTVAASSSPLVVPLPMSVEHAVDPEEAFVASISSCHMLWFLSIAAKKGYVVENYIDQARGVMSKNASGKLSITSVVLSPATLFSAGKQPTPNQLTELHHLAHENCFIANSVTSNIICNPTIQLR